MAKATEAATRKSAPPAKTTSAATSAATGRQTVVPPTEMTGAEALIRSLELAGATDIFGLPGGAILPAYDPLFDSTVLRHILVRHEQGAGHAASGYAHVTGRAGVAMVTSGPGATNLVTPIADANMDSIPMVCVTGQVARGLYRDGRVPGGGHRRHHPARHQAQRARHGRGPDRARHPGGVPHRDDGAPRPRARRHREVGASGEDDVLAGRRPSTCAATTPSRSLTPRRSRRRPACSLPPGGPSSTWAEA